ncbi:TerC family protein [Sporocytophaga myxococcoides]|uniref:TerC family protein n=1 Tax=Sporocytophaga myxococcoides TaxID=153721 RepID=UPI000426409C|nr:TerC family protein [Sporocytophaga myxococcoides]
MITILVSIFVLTTMEIVLGIDNIIFIGLLANGLQNKKKAALARKIGLVLALGVRIVALLFIADLAHMKDPLFSVTTTGGLNHPVSVRDLILLAGGLFLIHKSTSEIHGLFHDEIKEEQTEGTFVKVILQIVLIDLVFSADSILTAIGLVDSVEIMISAVVLSMTLMFFLSGKISDFVESRPSLKVLALSFLIMIGAMLVMEGSGVHVDKTYIYFAMAFAGIIEALNSKIKMRKTRVLTEKSFDGAKVADKQEFALKK